MKSLVITLSFLLASTILLTGQSADQQLSKCVKNAGYDARYLKDFRIQLGKSTIQNDLRFKTNITLWKNTKYRFSMCNSDESKGQLVLYIKDNTDKVILSSFDQKSGMTYPYVDLICNKSGVYHLNYDFINGQQGSGIGVVSIVK